MTVHIRFADLEDFSVVEYIAKQVHNMHIKGEPAVFQQSDEILPFHVYQSHGNGTDYYFVVAEEEEEIVGFLFGEIVYSPPIPTLKRRKCAHLLNIGVLEQHQQKGIGKLLFESCKVWAEEQSAVSLECLVWGFNTNAQQFYQNLGMETLNKNMILRLNNSDT